MPTVLVRRPNRREPRLLTPEDVARMYCYLVERQLYDREFIDAAIKQRCPSEEDKEEEERKAVTASAVGEVFGLDTLSSVYEQFLKANKFLEQDQKETKRLLKVIDILFEGIPLLTQVLKRIPLLSPVFAGIRRIRTQLRAREGRVEVLKAANDAAITDLDKARIQWELIKADLAKAA